MFCPGGVANFQPKGLIISLFPNTKYKMAKFDWIDKHHQHY